MPENENCEDIIYSEDYIDIIVDYQFFYEIPDIVSECNMPVSNKQSIIYASLQQNQITVDDIGYRFLPKCYGFLDMETLEETGVLALRRQPFINLYGQGVLVGIIDSGIDFKHEAFIWEDNTSKIVSVWNQEDRSGTPPEGFMYGSEYTREMLNEAIRSESSEYDSLITGSGHGTHIAAAAAGRIIEEADFSGVAPLAELVVVKLKQAKNILRDYYKIPEVANAFQENDILLGLRYILSVARERNMPLVICFGLGTNQGDHNGTGFLGEYLSYLAVAPGTYICTAAGNESGKAHHFGGNVLMEGEYQDVEILVNEESAGFSMELWGETPSTFAVQIKPPIGQFSGIIEARFNENRRLSFLLNNSIVYIDSELVERSTGDEFMFFRFVNPAQGIWTVRVIQQSETPGRFDIWLPIEEFNEAKAVFIEPDPNVTICEPANAANIITFAGSNVTGDVLYVNSSRGYTRSGRIKPDLTAPAVNVYTASAAGSVQKYGTVTGTSMACAIGGGATALIAEWSLTNQTTNSPSARNLLIRGADRTGITVPDRSWGFGRLDIYQTFVNIGQ